MTNATCRGCQALSRSLTELTNRVHRIFPDAEVKVKPMQTNALNSDCTKTDKEQLNRMLEEMFEESDMWLVEE